jgi:hypothetical protein
MIFIKNAHFQHLANATTRKKLPPLMWYRGVFKKKEENQKEKKYVFEEKK